MGGWLWQQVKPLVQNVRLPQVGVESVRIRRGELSATMAGEPIPRRISDVNCTVRFSDEYRNLVLDVAGDVNSVSVGERRCFHFAPGLNSNPSFMSFTLDVNCSC